MNDVFHHEATMRFLYGYVVRKNISPPGQVDIGQFQVTVFFRFCYVLLRNHEYIHCLNHRQAEDYITRRNKTERKL